MSIPESRILPERPQLEVLQSQAKRLLKEARASQADSLALIAHLHPRFRGERAAKIVPADLALHDAQLVIARQYGFTKWSDLKTEVLARGKAAQSADELLVQSIWRGNAEELESAVAGGTPRWGAELRATLSKALAGIVNRSVWHRPQYRRIAKTVLENGIACSIWDAARVGLLPTVSEMIAREPALLNARDEAGRTPMQRAALIYGSHPEAEATVQWLIAQGAEVDLHTAAAFSMTEIVEAHLRRDPEQAHVKVQGSTPLNWAVRPRSHASWPAPLKTVFALINFGTPLDTTDEYENGMQPLHHIGEWGNRDEMADLLIARGANLDATDDIGWTPLDYALDRNRTNMIACLKRHGAKQTRTDWPDTYGGQRDLIFASAKRGDAAAVERLLEENPALANAREGDGATPMHWAAHDGHYEVVEILLRHGADVQAQETRHWGGTPLHWAAERHPVIAQLLLDHGAPVNSRNERTDQTPLHYCARCDDVPEVAELLLARGADPELRDKKGNRPIDYARRAKHDAVAAVLEAFTAASAEDNF